MAYLVNLIFVFRRNLPIVHYTQNGSFCVMVVHSRHSALG